MMNEVKKNKETVKVKKKKMNRSNRKRSKNRLQYRNKNEELKRQPPDKKSLKRNMAQNND